MHTSEQFHRPAGLTAILRFVRHYIEMCAAMCVGIVVGDAIYFWLAGLRGYATPLTQLPELSVVVVTVAMTLPMAGWMLFRGMARRPTLEMSAAMFVLGGLLLGIGVLGLVERSSLALLEHGLMMPAMLIPMLLRRDLYTGGHAGHVG
jgi:hypothetical protein